MHLGRRRDFPFPCLRWFPLQLSLQSSRASLAFYFFVFFRALDLLLGVCHLLKKKICHVAVWAFFVGTLEPYFDFCTNLEWSYVITATPSLKRVFGISMRKISEMEG